MNKKIPVPSLKRGARLLASVLAAASGACFSPVARASSEAVADDAAAAKDQIMFLGLDISVDQPEGPGEVCGVARNGVIVDIDGTTRQVPRTKIGGYMTKLSPKVSNREIVVSKVVGERVYTPGNDPAMAAIVMQSQLSMYQQEVAERQSVAEASLSQAQQTAQNPGTGPEAASRAAAAKAAIPELQQSVSQMSQITSLDPKEFADINGRNDAGTYDAFDVTFEISSAETIKDAYAVLFMSVQVPTDPTHPQHVVTFQKLPPITSTPRKVRLTQRGLPQGFGYTDYQVHVYAGGREIPTNIAPRRINISKADAFQFMLFAYLSAHPGEFSDPVLASDLLGSDLRGHVVTGDLSRSVEVKVNADGKVTDVSLGGATSRDDDALVLSFIREAYFFPALAAGKQVDGTATLVLGDFVK